MAQPLQPLAGIRVLDLTANMSGPFATMILGDQGADVVKVEPPTGDVIRDLGTASAGMSAYFANLNRSKRSIVVDVRRPEARPVVDRLLDRSDVVVANYRPGVATDLGLDADSVRRTRPSIVYAEITGFGSSGPYAQRPAYDHIIQALSGFASIQADRQTGRPGLVRHGVIDKATGQAAAQAITAALLGRQRTGDGCHLEVRMLDVAIAFLWPDGMMNHTIDEPDRVLPSIVNTFRLTDTLDGQIAFMVVTQQQWSRLMAAMGLAYDPALDSAEGRMQQGGAHMRKIAAALGDLTTDAAVDRLSRAGVPVAPVLDLAAVQTHPQVVANETIGRRDHPVLGPIHQANPAVRFGSDTVEHLRPAPRLGEQTEEVLDEIGYGRDDIERLVASGAVGVPTT